ncbi:MAG: LysM domain-containing protein, partial [Anaerolineales bacterium]
MDKSKRRWLMIGGAILLILLILAGLFLGQFISRKKVFDARPLVLIHSPRTFDDFKVGDGVLVHATAREDHGLTRMELWVNDRLVDALDAEEPWPTNMTLVSSWVPTYPGNQVIVVKAVSAPGIDGKSTIQITAQDAAPLTHLVEEGDTLESVAVEYGTTPEELSDLNPDLGGGAPSPGESLVIPDREGAPEEPLPGDESGDPPPAEGDPPSLDWSIPFFQAVSVTEDRQVTLRLEIPGLRTWEGFDGLHCYVSLADSLPQWYPDLDHNQATDEYFSSLDNGWWDTEAILVGDSAPLISWPADQPLPLSIACVGERGGIEAVEMGLIQKQVQPEEWNGIRHGYESDGEGGHLLVEVKITQLSGDPRNTPKYPDPAMPRPYNLRLNQDEGL